MNFLLLSALTLLSFNAFSNSPCEYVETKIIYAGEPVEAKEEICKFLDTGKKITYYSSRKCVDKKCDFFQKKAILNRKDLKNGSPHFKLCQDLGGVPQIFSLKNAKGAWMEIERCFNTSNDFVEISALVDHFK